MASFQKEVVPLLISRQFRGVEGAFGPTSWRKAENRERLKRVLRGLDDVTGGGEDGSRCGHDKISSLLGMYASAKKIGGLGGFDTEEKKDDSERPAVDDLDDTTSSFPSTIHPYAVSGWWPVVLRLPRRDFSCLKRKRTIILLVFKEKSIVD
jgi:hypothetical protein